MKIGNAVGFATDNPVVCSSDIEEIYKRRKEAKADKDKEEAMQKVEEAKHAATQTTFEMMDRHIETVKKSQELIKKQARKRDIERLVQKRAEEHREMLAEMAVRDAERSDLLEAASMKRKKPAI
ncbi:MAG: hypothetical protein FWG71_06935 [Synergistaceae bacterium]|nr:hypothetical protein [Synergistaceae bacterium]